MSKPRVGEFQRRYISWSLVGMCFLSVYLTARATAPMALPRLAQPQKNSKPFKLDVRPLNPSPQPNHKVSVSVEILLLNAANEPAIWNRPCDVEVEVTAPSGRKEKYAVMIPVGQNATQLTFYVEERGLFFLKARETGGALLSGGNSVLIRERAMLDPWLLEPGEAWAHFVNASFHYRQSSVAIERNSFPHLVLVNSSGREEILADAKDFARLQVYFIDPSGKAASSDIRIWLSSPNGELSPQPLVIRTGESSAEARLISRSPAEAAVSLMSSSPPYPVEGQGQVEVSFGPAIYGIKLLNPNPLRLSLTDCEPLLAQFFDEQGRTVQTNKPRRITFASSSPALRLDPSSQQVMANGSGASVFIFPVWSGHAVLNVWTPGYAPQMLVVEVTMRAVVALCLCGGILGGIAAKGTLKTSLLWRGFAGVLGAGVLVWLCVYAALPQTHSIVAHNRVSVFVLSIMGGYGGTRVLDLVGKRMGYV
jgi:hypothetical protein